MFWSIKITVKPFALINHKLSKITGYYFVAIEADMIYLLKLEMGNLPNSSIFFFLIAISPNFLHNPAQNKYQELRKN